MRLVFKTVKTDRRWSWSQFILLCLFRFWFRLWFRFWFWFWGPIFHWCRSPSDLLPYYFQVDPSPPSRTCPQRSVHILLFPLSGTVWDQDDWLLHLPASSSIEDRLDLDQWTNVSGEEMGKMERFPLSFTLKAFFKVGPNLLSLHCFTAIKFNKTSSAAGGQRSRIWPRIWTGPCSCVFQIKGTPPSRVANFVLNLQSSSRWSDPSVCQQGTNLLILVLSQCWQSQEKKNLILLSFKFPHDNVLSPPHVSDWTLISFSRTTRNPNPPLHRRSPCFSDDDDWTRTIGSEKCWGNDWLYGFFIFPRRSPSRCVSIFTTQSLKAHILH